MVHLLRFFIAAVWFVNGFICKALGLVPRHQQIVARILGADHSFLLTKTIGVLEIGMALWVLSRIRPKLCTALQVSLVVMMNIIEYVLAPDLLLFGRFNSVYAAFFVVILILHERLSQQKQSASNLQR